MVWMDYTSPCNSPIGHSLKWRCCSLVWPISLSTKTSFDLLERDQSSFRLSAQYTQPVPLVSREAITEDQRETKGAQDRSSLYFLFYVPQHCFICRPSDSTVSEDAAWHRTQDCCNFDIGTQKALINRLDFIPWITYFYRIAYTGAEVIYVSLEYNYKPRRDD